MYLYKMVIISYHIFLSYIIIMYNYNILLKPSLYAHVLNGLLLLFAFILLLQYNKTEQYYRTLKIYLLFSIAVGVHGLSHFGLEFLYNYNSLQTLQQ
jgi:hypothetical protein